MTARGFAFVEGLLYRVACKVFVNSGMNRVTCNNGLRRRSTVLKAYGCGRFHSTGLREGERR